MCIPASPAGLPVATGTHPLGTQAVASEPARHGEVMPSRATCSRDFVALPRARPGALAGRALGWAGQARSWLGAAPAPCAVSQQRSAAAVHPQLRKDGCHMHAHGVLAQAQVPRNHLVGFARAQQRSTSSCRAVRVATGGAACVCAAPCPRAGQPGEGAGDGFQNVFAAGRLGQAVCPRARASFTASGATLAETSTMRALGQAWRSAAARPAHSSGQLDVQQHQVGIGHLQAQPRPQTLLRQ